MTDENLRPKVGVGVWIMRGGAILLGERCGAHGARSFSAPGGHLEFGESFAECAAREVREETGLTVKNIRFIGLTNDIFHGADKGKHYITIAMAADYDSGEPEIREPEKCLGWKWCDLDNLPKELFLPFKNLLKSEFAENFKEELEKSKEEEKMMKLSVKDLPNKTASLREIQGYVKKVAAIREYTTDIPTQMLFLTEEVGELAKAVREHVGAAFDEKTSRKELREEFHDVLANLLNIANMTGVDISDAFREKETADFSRIWKKLEEKK